MSGRLIQFLQRFHNKPAIVSFTVIVTAALLIYPILTVIHYHLYESELLDQTIFIYQWTIGLIVFWMCMFFFFIFSTPTAAEETSAVRSVSQVSDLAPAAFVARVRDSRVDMDVAVAAF